MLTQDQIDAGDARLSAGKLTDSDVEDLVSAMRLFCADLETLKGYAWESKLSELDDTGNTKQVAAKCAGALIIMKDLGFGVGAMDGGRDAIKFKEKDEYWQYVAYVHTKFYPIPSEFATYSLARQGSRAVSSTIYTRRVEGRMRIDSERAQRRRGW